MAPRPHDTGPTGVWGYALVSCVCYVVLRGCLVLYNDQMERVWGHAIYALTAYFRMGKLVLAFIAFFVSWAA